MDGIIKSVEKKEFEEEFSVKSYFVPLTNAKAITWIVVIGFIVYGNMLFNGFVWDDKTYIINNLDIQIFNFFRLIGENNSFNTAGYYRPIPGLYFGITYFFFRDYSFFYHFIQLAIHLINSSLLFIFFQKFFNKKLSLFLSLIFLVHPMNIESVSYISQSVSVLLLFFGISALIISGHLNIQSKLKIDVSIFIFLLLSLLTKESGIIFILLVLLYQFLFNNSYFSKHIIRMIVLSVFTLCLYLLIRVTIGKVFFSVTGITPIANLPLGSRLLNIPEVALYYTKTFLFPTQLIISQEWVIKNIDFLSFTFPGAILLALLFLFIYFGFYLYRNNLKQFKIYLFFSLWFLANMLLYLQIIPLDMTVADRWFYVPMIGLLGMIGTSIQQLVAKTKKTEFIKYLFLVIAIVIITVFSIRTITRNNDWRDALTLYTHDSYVLDSYNLEINLGTELFQNGEFNAALVHFKKSAELLPFENNLNNIGVVYEKLGNNQMAEKYYLMAITAKSPLYPKPVHIESTYINVVNILINKNKFSLANKYLLEGLKYYPNSPSLWRMKAMLEYKLNNH